MQDILSTSVGLINPIAKKGALHFEEENNQSKLKMLLQTIVRHFHFSLKGANAKTSRNAIDFGIKWKNEQNMTYVTSISTALFFSSPSFVISAS